MEFNCEQIVENYLIYRNPLYSFRFPLSILIAIIVFGCSKAYKWSDNSYINQILIPVIAFLLTMVLLDIIPRLMISNNEKIYFMEKCQSWINNTSNNEKFTIQDNSYNFNFSNEDKNSEEVKNKILQEKKNISIENVENPIEIIDKISPLPLEYKKDNSGLCIENSNGCNLCSGSNSNPFKLISPIPGPQWLPQTAEAVQNRLKNNNYTENTCKFLN
jgi:hypothetical protein